MTLVLIVMILSIFIDWLLYRFKPKLLWCMPVAVLILTGYLLIHDIYTYSSEPSFAEKWSLYFHNDASMGLYLIYLPLVGVNTIVAGVLYLIKCVKKKYKNGRLAKADFFEFDEE